MSTTRAELATAVKKDSYLLALGERVRRMRAQRGMTRKQLARQSGLSERFLASLESGEGNASIRVLLAIAEALGFAVEDLVAEPRAAQAELAHSIDMLKSLDPEELKRAHRMLIESFDWRKVADREKRIALIGLRGAGKSTIGAMLAERLGVPFLELDRLIEHASGLPMGALLDLYGQAGFRRMERRSLEDVIAQHSSFVLATGGSIVSEPATYERLLTHCYTVWLEARPEDHLARVAAQGDMRPMQGAREVMQDLRRILENREPLYARADLQVNTSDNSSEVCVARIVASLGRVQRGQAQ